MSDLDRANKLIEIRQGLGFSQNAMANLLELNTRKYQAFEWGECEIPNLYILAAERVALAYAVWDRTPMKAPPAIREEALILARLTEALGPAGMPA
ncbi:transcriptional regulator [Microvirga sp. TS319]|uniref:transcriptional regulator n=1 Tax=Microvirga sp. TS319 TaxID=3241165 RepID=UPI00351A6270